MATVAEAQSTTKNFTKLKRLLEELFQMDQADLDFGIFRIMNAKRDEVVQFLDKDLLPQVKEAFSQYQSADRSEIKSELDEAISQAKSLGADPDTIPRVKELREKYDSSAVDVAELESEVFSHLFNFFRRYYHEGDFISLRRYKEGVYAIPYEGEEVKLHWANHDQYYIKSSEYLRDYIFKLDSGERVRVHLVAASTEQDNNKSQTGTDRRFVLCDKNPIEEKEGELFIRFEYQLMDGKKKQDLLNKESVERIKEAMGADEFKNSKWSKALTKPAPTEKEKDRTTISKHLKEYTSRNTFDYFIHKDLGGFLLREMDFYIKNEVMHLDDVESDSALRVEQYLSKIKVIRRIGHRIIAFLKQLEDFQRKLWLKKKFVVKTDYCITLDRIPIEHYPTIAANDLQRKEWVELFGIDKIESGLHEGGYTVPLSAEFLSCHPMLPVCTSHFDASVKDKLMSSIEFAEQANCLAGGENSQYLRHLIASSRSSVKLVYIDPPYNTGKDDFVYKDRYQHSSWCACIFDRLLLAKELLADDGAIMVSIGHEELGTLQALLDSTFGRENRISVVTVKRASVTGHKVINPGVVNVSEFVLIYALDRQKWKGNTIYSERERDERYSTYVRNRDSPLDKWELVSVLEQLAFETGVDKRKLRKHFGEDYSDKVTEFVYANARSVCQPVTVDLAGVGAEFREWVKKSKDSSDEVLLYERDGFPDAYLLNGKKIIFYEDKMMRVGERFATAEKASDIWTDVLPNDLHNEGGVELPKGKKPEALLSRLIELGTNEGDLVLDFFAGTATTAAVAQKMNRKWLACESATYLDDKPLRRMKNVLQGEGRGVSGVFGWSGGGMFKVALLESYEDALNNLEFKKDGQQELALEQNKDLKEQYILSYMLDVESRGSQSLLNVDGFRNPDEYKLKVERNGETQLVNVDLVETFNRLLGLTVKHIDVIGTKATGRIRVVTGTNPEGEKVLVLWRNQDNTDNEALEKWFTKQGYNSRDQEYDLIYINGDNNLENLRKEDETWKVRLIEEEFGRLMFDVVDV